MKRWIKWLVALELVYVVASAIFLNAGFLPRLINSSTDEINIQYDYAYSLIPGRVQISGIRFRLQDSNVQLFFKMSHTGVSVKLLPLFSRQFRTSRVEGKDLSFFFRFKRPEAELKQVDLSALPSIPGLTSLVKTVHEAGPPPENPWKILLEGVSISPLKELWFEEFRFLGKAVVEGGFYLHPKKRVRIEPSKVRIESGTVMVGPREAIQSAKGEIDCTISEFDPNKVPGFEIFKSIVGRVKLDTHIKSIAFLNYYLKEANWIRLSEGEGDAKMDLRVDAGDFVEGSSFNVQSDNLIVQLWKQIAKGKGLVTWAISKEKLNRLELKLAEFSLQHANHPEYQIKGNNLSMGIQTQTRHGYDSYKDLEISLHLPRATMSDVRYWNAYLPKASRLQFDGGEGFIRAEVTSSLKNKGKDSGVIELGAKNASFHYGTYRFRGDVDLRGLVNESSLQEGKVLLSGTRLGLANVTSSTKNGDDVIAQKWWADMVLSHTTLFLDGEPDIESTVELQSLNGRPITAFLSELSAIPGWVQSLFSFNDLKLGMHIKVGEERLEIRHLDAIGDHSRLRGWFKDDTHKKNGLFLINYGPFAAALELSGDKTRLRLQDAAAWFNERNIKTAE